MCNRARYFEEPETLRETRGLKWWTDRPMDNRFDPVELVPRGAGLRETPGRTRPRARHHVVGCAGRSGGLANDERARPHAATRAQAGGETREPCLIPCTEFCEWTPGKHDLGDGKPPIKGEMWFQVTDQPVFAVAGFWQRAAKGNGFTMVTCDPNELVAPIHPKAMITILKPEDQQHWLECPLEDVMRLQCPYPAERHCQTNQNLVRSSPRPAN